MLQIFEIWPLCPQAKALNHWFFCGVKVTKINATGLDCGDNLFCSRLSETTILPSVLTRNSHNFNLLINTDMENVISECLWKCQFVQLTVCLCVFCRNKLRSSWRKRKLNVRSWENAKALWRRTKTNCLLISKLWLRRMRRSVCWPLNPNHFIYTFFNQSNFKICYLMVHFSIVKKSYYYY